MNCYEISRNVFVQRLSAIWIKFRYVIIVIITSGCYAGILFNQTFPFSEGWYTYYAQCINNGQIVYKDFDYLFTPLYINLISLITKVFGYKLIVLRFIGIIFFCLIACIVFMILKEVFSEGISCIASITAVFFLQSEVCQVFYDYVRLMDIFACLTILFLVKAVKRFNQKPYIYLFASGISNALFFLVKQNMGILFCIYVIILLICLNVVLSLKFKSIRKTLGCFLLGFIIPIIITSFTMMINGSFVYFFKQTGSDAIAAKGGILAILFGWIKNNRISFLNSMKFSVLLLIILVFLYIINKKFLPENQEGKRLDNLLSYIYACITIITIVIFARSESIATSINGYALLSPYSVFLVVFPIFCMLVIHVIILKVKKQLITNKELIFIVITGSYFAISYGCGMSGGLAEGQATIGVAFIVSLLLSSMDFKWARVPKCVVVMLCFWVTIQSAEKKMEYTYNWWGLDESNFWDSGRLSDDIEILEGIALSEETLNAVETIYRVITDNTTENDSIYCFPQIPIFYSICNRTDPGVRAKVQWFDVASDSSIQQDISVIEKNPPRAILIYETSEYAYSSHEKAFRLGEISATRKMKQFLLDYACQHGYTFYGRITSTKNNHFLLYYNESENYEQTYSFLGDGTMNSPYIIENENDLLELKKSVDYGNDFSGVYFRQTKDIDLSSVENWKPIGEFMSGMYFGGIYDGGGHVIRNLHCLDGGDCGLFGQLGGIVCNLGIVDSYISGSCVGVIASHSIGENAMVINCYTDTEVRGLRAGGIVDDFAGSIYNCITNSQCHGIEYAGAVSYDNGSVKNVFALAENISSEIINSYGNSDVKYTTKDYFESRNLVQILNEEIRKINECKIYFQETGETYNENMSLSYAEWMSKIDLIPWKNVQNSYPVFDTK